MLFGQKSGKINNFHLPFIFKYLSIDHSVKCIGKGITIKKDKRQNEERMGK